MDTYPLPFELSTTVGVDDDIRIDRSMDGTPRLRGFYTRARQSWVLSHAALNASELSTFKGFYNAHRHGVAFYVSDDCGASQYSVVISGAPTYAHVSPTLTAVTLPVTESA